MPKRFMINVGGTRAIAELLEREAPRLSQRMWENLPVESFGVHAKFAGHEMIVMVPFYAEPENELLDVQPGDIGYYPGRQTICIFYGDTRPFGFVSVFARVVERLDELQATGERVLRAGIVLARLERVEEDSNAISDERALVEMEDATARVLGELRNFIARCWLHEPADIAALRSVSRPPMGNLPCCFYANFNLFWAGETLQVCRQQVKDGVLAVPVVCQMLAGLLERHAARLEKWSMTEAVALERMLAQYFKMSVDAGSVFRPPNNQTDSVLASGSGGREGAINRVPTTEEFLAVVEHAMIALDRVQSWIDGLLPWSDLDARLALRRPITVT